MLQQFVTALEDGHKQSKIFIAVLSTILGITTLAGSLLLHRPPIL
jgi:hypothetical protein